MNFGLGGILPSRGTQRGVRTSFHNHKSSADQTDNAQSPQDRRFSQDARSHDGEEEDNEPSSQRDGKFYDLSTFMVLPENFKPSYLFASQLDLKPGQIIYINDRTKSNECEETRLHRRVMLVIRAQSSATVTCLTFCRHMRPANSEDHWRVCDDKRTENTGPNSRLTPLEVTLQPAWPATTTPQPGITINIRDFWNVETIVRAAVLGTVDTVSMQALVKRIKELFCQSMDEAVPPMPEPEPEPKPEPEPSPVPVDSEVVEVRPNGSGKKKQVVYMRVRKISKK